MGAGTWTLACLLLVGQVPSDVVVRNQRGQLIPFGPLSAAQRQEIKDVLLFVSKDEGKSWQQTARVGPDQNGFALENLEDGLYWLRVATVNRQGKQEPDNLYQASDKNLVKMLIDSVKPLVRITTAHRQGDDVVVAWEIIEDHPDLSSLKLEYHTAENPNSWAPVALTASLKGETRFRLINPGQVDLRMEIKDAAGNLGFAPATVPGTQTLASNRSPVGGAPGGPASVSPPVVPTPGATSPTGAPPQPVFPQTPAPPPAAAQGIAPPAASAPVSAPPFSTQAGAPPLQAPPALAPPPITDARFAPPPAPQQSTPQPRPFSAPPGASALPPPPHFDPNTQLVASSDGGVPGAGPAHKPLPALQYINANEVTLEYELTRIGPSGIGSIELWWTQNDGQTWERYAVDDSAKPDMRSGRYQRTVELQGDGVYGFALVLKSRAGLGKHPPKTGDVPEVRIEVDTQAPAVGLFAPQADSRPGHLLLQWTAKDNNLTATPITLEWCERKDGQWQTIAANLPNSGRHSWQPPEGTPYQVYLRLRARDAAGNEGVAVTTDPQLIDLSEPEGRLVNVIAPTRRP